MDANSASSNMMPVPRRGLLSFLQNTINPSFLGSHPMCFNPSLSRLVHPSTQLMLPPVLQFNWRFQPFGGLQSVNNPYGFPRVVVSDSYMATVKRTFEKIFSEENRTEKRIKPNNYSSSTDKFHEERVGSTEVKNEVKLPGASTVGFASMGVKQLFNQDIPFRDPSRFKRKWRQECSKNASKWNKGDFKFSILCYNVLAQGLLESNSYLYHQVHPMHLNWNYRKANLMHEILCLRSDIVCLQEVEHEHYIHFFQPSLAKHGYTGFYKKRTGNKTDGCAIFFKNNRFRLVVSKAVSYNKRHIPLLDRDNVGIIVLLQSVNEPQRNVCVATTHLLFNPRRGDIKLAQLGLFLAEIDQVSHYQVEDGSYVQCPIILCGDLNSVPESPLSEFLQKGSLDFRDIPSGEVSGQKEGRRGGLRYLHRPPIPPALKINRDCQYISALVEREEQKSKQQKSKTTLKSEGENKEQNKNVEDEPWEDVVSTDREQSSIVKHSFSFSSVYSLEENNKEITSNHSRTNCMVDYIYYSSSSSSPPGKTKVSLELVSSLQLFTDDEAKAMGGLPNKVWSSDHFSLMASFLLR